MELALALFDLAQNVAVAAVRIAWHLPYVDCRKAACCANVNGWRVWGTSVVPPLTEVTEEGDSADLDVNSFWDVDIDVPEDQQNGRGRARPVDGSLAQVREQFSQQAGGGNLEDAFFRATGETTGQG